MPLMPHASQLAELSAAAVCQLQSAITIRFKAVHVRSGSRDFPYLIPHAYLGAGGRRYCATHQEMREAIARGLDGPGISPLDVMPQTWAHCPGFEEEMEHRRRKVEAIKVQRPHHRPARLGLPGYH